VTPDRVSTAGPESAIRSFVALDLAPQVIAALAERQHELRSCGADVRWALPEGMHLTLKFLGAVEPGRLTAVAGLLAPVVASQRELTLRIDGLGAFPDLQRPRVLWAGVACDGLSALAHAIDRALVGLGFPAATGAFRPHITLGRVRSREGWVRLRTQIEAHRLDSFGVTRTAAVSIYRSQLMRGGSVYTLLDTLPLAPAGGAMDNSTSRK